MSKALGWTLVSIGLFTLGVLFQLATLWILAAVIAVCLFFSVFWAILYAIRRE